LYIIFEFVFHQKQQFTLLQGEMKKPDEIYIASGFFSFLIVYFHRKGAEFLPRLARGWEAGSNTNLCAFSLRLLR
jgi:hypothetical protein